MTGFTTVSAAHLQDSTGAQISNATIAFQPVLNNGSPTSFKSGGAAGQTIDTAVTAQVTSGAFSIQLADTSLTNPRNVGYRVTLTDNVSGKVLLAKGYECVQPTGSTWSFDAYTPNLAPQITLATGPAGLSAYQLYQAGGGELSQSAWLASMVAPPIATLSYTFTAVGTHVFVHNLATLTPSITVIISSGCTLYKLAVIDENSVSISVPGACAMSVVFTGSGPAKAATVVTLDLTFPPPLTPATVTLTMTNAIIIPGQSITLTATVSPSGATGSVSFYDGSTLLGTGTIASGVATLTTSAIVSGGVHSIDATYSGDTTYASATSATSTVTVAAHYWPMHEGSGSTFTDVAGGLNLTAPTGNAPTWGSKSGFSGTVATLSNGAITSAPISIERTQPFTWFGFFELDALPSGGHQSSLMSNVPVGYHPGIELFVIQAGQVTFSLISDTGTSNLIQVQSISPAAGTVYHIAVTYDGSSTAAGVRIYINGALATMTTVTDSLTGTLLDSAPYGFVVMSGVDTNSLTIPLAADAAAGTASRVGIFLTQLTAPQVLALYNSLTA